MGSIQVDCFHEFIDFYFGQHKWVQYFIIASGYMLLLTIRDYMSYNMFLSSTKREQT